MDWTKSMQQTFEFYVVDPVTWMNEKVLDNTVESCTINRDSSSDSLGYATFDCSEELDECYIRPYLVTIQNGITERFPLGTFLVQTPSVSFDGKKTTISMDAYTPLIELSMGMPPIGYTVFKDDPTMDIASSLCRENMRAPVVAATSDHKLYDDFVANTDDTWLTFLVDLIDNAEYEFELDEMGRVLFAPVQDTASLQSVWIYDDDNSSILLPEIEDERDMFDVPNVVEVVYSTGDNYIYSRISNDDPNSPSSTVSRGREVLYRETSPNLPDGSTQEAVDDYATALLRNLSCLEHTVTYSHGFCPVVVGNGVTLNYKRAGIVNVKAKVTSQSIKCETGCTVEETAVYTTQLWR